MKLAEYIKRSIKNGHVSVHPDADKRIFGKVLQRFRMLNQTKSEPAEHGWWRTIMKNPIIKLATLATIAIILVLWIMT